MPVKRHHKKKDVPSSRSNNLKGSEITELTRWTYQFDSTHFACVFGVASMILMSHANTRQYPGVIALAGESLFYGTVIVKELEAVWQTGVMNKRQLMSQMKPNLLALRFIVSFMVVPPVIQALSVEGEEIDTGYFVRSACKLLIAAVTINVQTATLFHAGDIRRVLVQQRRHVGTLYQRGQYILPLICDAKFSFGIAAAVLSVVVRWFEMPHISDNPFIMLSFTYGMVMSLLRAGVCIMQKVNQSTESGSHRMTDQASWWFWWVQCLSSVSEYQLARFAGNSCKLSLMKGFIAFQSNLLVQQLGVTKFWLGPEAALQALGQKESGESPRKEKVRDETMGGTPFKSHVDGAQNAGLDTGESVMDQVF